MFEHLKTFSIKYLKVGNTENYLFMNQFIISVCHNHDNFANLVSEL